MIKTRTSGTDQMFTEIQGSILIARTYFWNLSCPIKMSDHLIQAEKTLIYQNND